MQDTSYRREAPALFGRSSCGSDDHRRVIGGRGNAPCRGGRANVCQRADRFRRRIGVAAPHDVLQSLDSSRVAKVTERMSGMGDEGAVRRPERPDQLVGVGKCWVHGVSAGGATGGIGQQLGPTGGAEIVNQGRSLPVLAELILSRRQTAFTAQSWARQRAAS